MLLAGVMMGAWQLPGLRALLAGTIALPVLATVLTRLGYVIDGRAALRRLIGKGVEEVLQRIALDGAAVASTAVARGAVVGVARQVLGYATLGLAIVGDIVLTREATSAMGAYADAMIRPWGTGMLVEGASWLDAPGVADCVATVLGGAIGADGRIDDAERALLAAHLDRRVWRGDTWSTPDALATIADRANTAAAEAHLTEGGPPDAAWACADTLLHGAPVDDRMAILSWVRTMMSIDGDLSDREAQGYATLEDDLRGADWFGDGAELDPAALTAMKKRIDVALVHPAAAVDASDSGLVGELRPSDPIEQLGAVAPPARAAVDCAFDGCAPAPSP